MYRQYIRNNITTVSIILFIVVFFILQYFKPDFLYNKDGSLRQFGLGYKKKTVIPVWLVTIFLSILSYLFVLYYLAVPRLF